MSYQTALREINNFGYIYIRLARKSYTLLTYKIRRGDFVVVTERVEKHGDWKLLVFRAERPAGPKFGCETVNRGYRLKPAVQR